MDKDKKEWEKKATCAYVPPLIEVHAVGSGRLMAGSSYYGDHQQGDIDGDNESDHQRGDINLIDGSVGAKILDRDFSFSDIWED